VAGRGRVALLSSAAARSYFPGQNPVGRTIRIEDREHAEWQVVGVVGDVRSQRLDREPRPQVYVPAEQSPAGSMTLVLRANGGNPLALCRPLEELVRRADREQALADVKTMVAVVNDSSARWRVSTFLFAGFGGMAIVLAVTGLFSITSFTVAQRTREIAIRLALGESHRGVVRLIVRSLAGVIVAGSGAGLACAMILARALSTLLYRVEPGDARSFAVAAFGFAALVLVTGVVSASRTARIDPRAAMQAE
jgi:hypothetical protein